MSEDTFKYHANITEADGLHEPKLHAASHYGSAVDEIDWEQLADLKTYIDSQISGENHWDLNSGNILVPYVTGADVVLGTGEITAANLNITNWDTAYSWGNHAGLYDLLGTASSLIGTHQSTYNHDNYNTAYSWGNHASVGYLTAVIVGHGLDVESANTVLVDETDLDDTLIPFTGSGFTATNVHDAILEAYNDATVTTWGDIAGTLSNQTDLQGALDAKEPTLSKGNLTETTSSILTFVGGTGAVIGSGTTIQVQVASSGVSGYLSGSDWNTFNNKQDALTIGNGLDLNSGNILVVDETELDSTLLPFSASGISATNVSDAIVEMYDSIVAEDLWDLESGTTLIPTTIGANLTLSTGALTADTLTDGTASLTSGSLTSVKLGSLTTNGFVKTSGSDGTLSVDTNTYYTQAELGATTIGSAGTNLIKIPIVAGATYTTLTEFHNAFGSAGRHTGGEVTDAGSGTLNIAAGTGFIKANDVDTDELISFNWSAVNGAATTINQVNYVMVEWNNGSPQAVVTTDEGAWDLDTSFPLAKICNENNSLNILNNPWWVTDGTTNIVERLQGFGLVMRDVYTGGLVLSVGGTRNVAVTTGKLWSRLNEFDIEAIDTNVATVASHSAVFDVDNGSSKGTITASAGTPYSVLTAGKWINISGTGDNNGNYKIESITGDNVITCTTVIAGTDGTEATTVIKPTLEIYWRSGASTWTDSHINQYPITQYNRLSDNTLQTINNNQYFNWWVYAEADSGEIAMVYPQATYTSAAGAEAAAPPSSLPLHISENALLIGRILCKQGVDAPVQVQSAWTQQFTASAAADHGNLAGLTDDDHTQYSLVTGTRAFTGDIKVNTTRVITGLHTVVVPITSPTSSDDMVIFKTPRGKAITLVNAYAWVEGDSGTDLTLKLQEANSVGDSGSDICNATVIGLTETAISLTDTVIASNNTVTYTSSATTGTVNRLYITFEYSIN